MSPFKATSFFFALWKRFHDSSKNRASESSTILTKVIFDKKGRKNTKNRANFVIDHRFIWKRFRNLAHFRVKQVVFGKSGLFSKQARLLLTPGEEITVYDALEVNDSAVQVLGDQNLKIIACELLVAVRNNVPIDWMPKENVRAKLRVMVRRILRRYGYPPDMQEKPSTPSSPALHRSFKNTT